MLVHDHVVAPALGGDVTVEKVVSVERTGLGGTVIDEHPAGVFTEHGAAEQRRDGEGFQVAEA